MEVDLTQKAALLWKRILLTDPTQIFWRRIRTPPPKELG
jgi:hypothetical protein